MHMFAWIDRDTLCVKSESANRFRITYGDELLVTHAHLPRGGTLTFAHGPWRCRLERRIACQWLRTEVYHLVVRVGDDILHESFHDKLGREMLPHEIRRDAVLGFGSVAGILLLTLPSLAAYFWLVPYDGTMYGKRAKLIIAFGLAIGVMIGCASAACVKETNADRALYANA